MKEYYVGLDVGTDSVGWAATDTEYNLLKYKGNAQWGIRLLEESHTADERRSFRSARRRGERKKYRLQCLEMLFDSEVSRVDPAFFLRLHESDLWAEDKTGGGVYSLFHDAEYTDVDYHRDYPTIYHLRKRLIENPEPVDVRLVYLAVHHIIKNRGHFLFDSESNGTPDFREVWNELTTCWYDEHGVELNCESVDEVQTLLKDKTRGIREKQKALAKAFSIKKEDKQSYALVSLLAGGTVKAEELFDDDSLKENAMPKLSFSSGYEERLAEYAAALGDRLELLQRAKAVYDWAVLADVLKGFSYLSCAKCTVYDQHKKDLATLKGFVRAYFPQKYRNIFGECVGDSQKDNYSAYSGHCKNAVSPKKCSQEEFLKFLSKELSSRPEPIEDSYLDMYQRIESGTFMPKLVTRDNAVIPMQLNKKELEKILENAAGYLPFLLEADSDGKTVKDKIMAIFSWRIPYSVGPLNRHSEKAWLERTAEKIYPWNFEDVVDVEKSAESFIQNLIAKCTYIPTEDVLPQNSLLYAKYRVLDELNKLKVNGEPIRVELKKEIYQDLFLNNPKASAKVSAAQVKKYLKSKGGGDCEISGIDGNFKNSLKPLRDLKDFPLSDAEKERVVQVVTVFGEDKKLLKKRLRKEFGEKLSEEELLSLSRLKYSDWGRLSKRFLQGVSGVCKETGEVGTILEFLWSTNDNLMQLLSDRYTFRKELDEINGWDEFSSLKKEVNALYVSPKVKRPIYQAMQIVQELVKINGCAPKKIFVEVARGAEEKKPTVSRKKRLMDLYQACRKDNDELFERLQDTPEEEFRRDALYLYYTQLGRCMYSGETISVEDIFNRNLYDIDHIFPQSKIKDDSLDNRVLVKKQANQEKAADYPLAQAVRERQRAYWDSLRKKDLISAKKYERLTRSRPLTEDELGSFISRQLVETRQSTKAIAELLEKRYSSAKTKVVYVKAGLVSDFRNPSRYDFVKCREINDFHHAKDAYLNIVVGNVYNTRFTQNWFIADLLGGKVSLNRLFDYDIEGAWTAKGEHKSIDTVRKTMAKNNIRFTRYSYCQKGGLFDQQPVKAKAGLVPLKGAGPRSDTAKYGGYNRPTASYFAFVSYTSKKSETVKQFLPIDLYREKEYRENPERFVEQELSKDNNFNGEARVLIPCVKYNALVSVNGFRMHISCKSGPQIVYKPAMQLVLDASLERYIKHIVRYCEKCTEPKKEKPITKWDEISAPENQKLYAALLEKLQNTVFRVKFSNLANIMETRKAGFEGRSVCEQCKVLVQILTILHCNVRLGDLRLLDEAQNCGKVTTGNKIAPSKDIKSFKLIHQSVTGLFEQEVELLG